MHFPGDLGHLKNYINKRDREINTNILTNSDEQRKFLNNVNKNLGQFQRGHLRCIERIVSVLDAKELNLEQLKPLVAFLETHQSEQKKALLSQLFLSITTDDETLLSYLKEKGADLNFKNKQGLTLLQCAVKENNPVQVLRLLELGADKAVLDNSGKSLLHLAVNSPAAMHLLLIKGMDPNIRDQKHQRTPLHIVSNNDLASLLIEYGASIEAEDFEHRTPLFMAIFLNRIDIAKILLDKGALTEPDLDAGGALFPLHIACDFKRPEIARLLLDYGADVNAVDTDNRTPLWHALDVKEPEIAQLLVEKGANLKTKDFVGDTPLHRAAYEGYTDLVHLMIEKGAPLEVKNIPNDWNPLNYIHQIPYFGPVLKWSFRTDWITKPLFFPGIFVTPLQVACVKGHVEIVDLLVKNGANIDVTNSYADYPSIGHPFAVGFTPLHSACKKGFQEVAALLIEHGANLSIKDYDGKTALDIAKERGMNDLVLYAACALKEDLSDTFKVTDINRWTSIKKLSKNDVTDILSYEKFFFGQLAKLNFSIKIAEKSHQTEKWISKIKQKKEGIENDFMTLLERCPFSEEITHSYTCPISYIPISEGVYLLNKDGTVSNSALERTTIKNWIKTQRDTNDSLGITQDLIDPTTAKATTGLMIPVDPLYSKRLAYVLEQTGAAI